MSERVCVFIDGGNFYHLVLKRLGVLNNDFDFAGFANFLASTRTICENGKRFYVGTVREQPDNLKSKEAMSQQTKLFSTLKSARWEILTSKLRIRREELPVDRRIEEYQTLIKCGIKTIHYERWREKGIDVKIATDLIAGALDNKYDTAILVSSDGDLIPAIDWVRHRPGKKIEYIGFSIADRKNPARSTRPLLSMIPRTDIQRTLVEEDIRKFLVPKLLS